MNTILVIEDEATVRESLQDWLEVEGFRTLGAENGFQGIQMAQTYFPDLIVCDVQMPEMDGYEVLETLHQNPATTAIPFIFLTGRDTRLERRRGMDLGADDYLTKPCSPEELLRAITSRLQKQQQLQARSREELESLRSSITLSLPHEFRTPLTGILSGVELLQVIAYSATPETILEIAGNIQISTERLYRLVENYLLYAELQSAARNLDHPRQFSAGQVLSPATIIHYVAQQIVHKLGRSADLQLNLQDIAIALPQNRLEKILEEVLSNACKFSLPGTPIQIESLVKATEYQILVCDQGQGMTVGQIAQLGAYMQFERAFYEQQGLGLGLAIVQHLLHQYQGRLQFESIPGQGTRAILSLPLWQR